MISKGSFQSSHIPILTPSDLVAQTLGSSSQTTQCKAPSRITPVAL